MTAEGDDDEPPTPPRGLGEALMGMLDAFGAVAEAAVGMRRQLIEGGFDEANASLITTQFILEVVVKPMGERRRLGRGRGE